MKQILLITDGCSNVGLNPVMAASQAREADITVNVIGIVDGGEMGFHGTREIEEIAEAGGGMSRVVQPRQLTQTVQMMTRRTVMQTIHKTVQQELKQIVGHGQIEELPPEQRAKVVKVMDRLAESEALQVALLIDTSASMKTKLAAVEEAIRDLGLSLQAREGNSLISVLRFPGNGSDREGAEVVSEWTSEVAKLHKLFYKLSMKGSTPTGPAILSAVGYIEETLREKRTEADGRRDDGFPQPDLPSVHAAGKAVGGDGMLRDFMV